MELVIWSVWFVCCFIYDSVFSHGIGEFTTFFKFSLTCPQMVHGVKKITPVLLHVFVLCQHRPHRIHKPHTVFPKQLYLWDISSVYILSVFNKCNRKWLKMCDVSLTDFLKFLSVFNYSSKTSIDFTAWQMRFKPQALTSAPNPRAFNPLVQFVWVGLNGVRDLHRESNNRTPVILKREVSGHLQANSGAIHHCYEPHPHLSTV